jgi:hypothetical protein
MEFKDRGFVIFLKLEKQFRSDANQINLYSDYIKAKDLGIICVSLASNIYRIVDKKKWILTKIKYGFNLP